MGDEATKRAYAEVPYRSFPWRYAHPDHLETIALLYGLTPEHAPTSRVLEIGCADGGNCIPIGLAWPECQVLGIDLAPGQIEAARRRVEALGLTNVRLEAMSFADLESGEFDYVIAHGLLSWVEEPHAHCLLDVIRDRLAPNGVAVITYNVYPGWRFREPIREMLLQRVEGIDDLRERTETAIGYLGFLRRGYPRRDDGFSESIDFVSERANVPEERRHYFAHDYLAAVNRPLWFRDFAAQLAEHGLAYVGDADQRTMGFAYLPPELAAEVRTWGEDRLEIEETLDHLRNRSFRQSVVTKAGASVANGPDFTRLPALHAATELTPTDPSFDLVSDAPVEFRSASGVATEFTHPLTRALLVAIREAWPRAVPLNAAMGKAAGRLAAAGAGEEHLDAEAGNAAAVYLVNAWLADLVELHASPSPFTRDPGDRPVASPLARLQVTEGESTVSTLRHEQIEIPDAGLARLLPLLDGTHDRASLRDEFGSDLEPLLAEAARLALLTA